MNLKLIHEALTAIREFRETPFVDYDFPAMRDRADDLLNQAILEIQNNPTMKLAIIVEGGLVQGVVSDKPDMYPLDIICIDYDTEGAEAEDLILVKQGKGGEVEAFASRYPVTDMAIQWPDLAD